MTELIFTAVLAFHLICANVATAGPLVCLWCEFREAKGGKLEGEAGRWLALWSFNLLVLGTLSGVVLGALLWDDAYRASLKLLGSKVFWGGIEWLFSLVLSGAYVLWWRATTKGRWLRCLLALLSGTNLLYHFPFLFTVLADLSEVEPVSSARFRELIVSGPILSRAVHIILACFAVTGTAWIWLATRWVKQGREHEAAVLAKWGGMLAMGPTMLQLVVGMWIVTQMNRTQQMTIMGTHLLASLAFVVSIVLALWLMHLTAAVAFGRGGPGKWKTTLAVMLVVVVLMSYVTRATREDPRNIIAPDDSAAVQDPQPTDEP